MRPSASDQDLLEATRAGDADAFGEFFARHAETVLVFLRRRAGSAELAADLTAETFAAALLAVHRGHAGKVPNGAAWLLGIARHKLIDSYRGARVEATSRFDAGIPELTATDEDLDRIDRLAGVAPAASIALDQLSDDEREAIVERILRERAYDEIAADAGVSETAIRKRVSRGLTRLRAELGAQPR